MTYEAYRYIFLGGAILAVIMFAISILLFFVLHIPNVIGDLNGTNARRGIENIRLHNENTGQKTYRSSHVNTERGKITDKISHSGRIMKNPSHSLHGAMETEKISSVQSPHFGLAAETELLDSANKGEIAGETTLLTSAGSSGETARENSQNDEDIFTIEYEITYIHTNEIIV